MKYIDFQNKFKDYPIIDVREVKNVFPDFDSRRFYEWQKKGYIKKISKLFYFFNNKMISEENVFFIANKLLEPSYISLERALSFYNLIPENVFMVSSVSTKKTKLIKNQISNFNYRSIKKSLFFAYKLIKVNNFSFKIAEAEKALLDLLYLRSDIKTEKDILELRINENTFCEIIDIKKMEKYARQFNSKTLFNKFLKIKKQIKC